MENRRSYADVLDNWAQFCSKNNLTLEISRKSETSSGGALQYLYFEAINDSKTITILQSFFQADSWLEFVERPHKLNFLFESRSIKDIQLSIWEKDFFERLFKRNKIISGNLEFDSTFSGSCNDMNFMNELFEDIEIQDSLLTNRLLLLNLTTKRDSLRISLKNMQEKYYTTDNLVQHYDIFSRIVDRVLNLI